MVAALDFETTGLDVRHAARPFTLTTCEEDGTQQVWVWDIDPYTRRLIRKTSQYNFEDDLDSISEWLESKLDEGVVMHNAKFDLQVCRSVGLFDRIDERKVLQNLHDTMMSAHLVGSNDPKNLTDQLMLHVGWDLEPLERNLDKACKDARKLVMSKAFIAEHGRWMWAEAEMKGLPSLSVGKRKSKNLHKNDMWLPRTVAQHLDYPSEHPWWNVTQIYAVADPTGTLLLYKAHQEEIKERKLEKMYEEQMKTLQVTYRIECGGVGLSRKRLDHLATSTKKRSQEEGKNCVRIASEMDYELVLPKGASPNDSIREFCYDVLNLPPMYSEKSRTDAPSLCKEVMEEYLLILDGVQLEFVKSLYNKRSKDTALGYLDSYRKFWLPMRNDGDTFIVYPQLNPVNTRTLRFTSEYPNEQQVKKRPDEDEESDVKGLSPRYGFGPGPDREWFCFDYSNLELRIPFYKSKQQELIALFERPNDPPYYGSSHIANFHVVYPDLWEEAEYESRKAGWRIDKWIKEFWRASHYQNCKNGGFSKQYGGQRRKVDATFRREGAFNALESKFDKLAAYNAECIAFAEKHGYIDTLPDKTVDPTKGYPLQCKLTERGQIKPTIPLNYRVQGTAMWCTRKAMWRCQEQLDEWNWKEPGANYRIVLQVHDEIDFDFPKRGRANIPKVNRIRQLMEMSGDDIGIPLKVSAAWHPNNWHESVPLRGLSA